MGSFSCNKNISLLVVNLLISNDFHQTESNILTEYKFFEIETDVG